MFNLMLSINSLCCELAAEVESAAAVSAVGQQ